MASNCGTITVVDPFDASNVTVDGCANVPAEASPGDTITISTTVSNGNDADASAAVVLSENQTQIASKDVTVGGTATVTFDVTLPNSPGDYTYTTTVENVSKA
jgi:hypothetical protein